MVVCEAECLALALVGGDAPAGTDLVQHDAQHLAGSGPASYLHEAGPCHMAATPISGLPADRMAAHVPTGEQWAPQGPPRFGSVAWPPPRPRPKAITS
jgi:hypothetical protein